MKRSRLHSDPAKLRAWRERSRKELQRTAINKVSAKQAAKNKVHSSMRVNVGTRANECCEKCGKYAPLSGHPLEIGHAHHVVPRGRGGENVLSNYLYLCPGCHNEIHFGAQQVEGGK